MSLTTEPQEGDIPVAEVVSGPHTGMFVYLKSKCCMYHKPAGCASFPCCEHCDPYSEGQTSIKLSQGEFMPMVRIKKGVFQAAHIMAGGTSECGKTYFFAQMALQYQKAFPNNRIYYFAMNNDPSVVEAMVPGVMRIGLEDMEAGAISPASLAGSLVIIDDCDNTNNVPEGMNAALIKKRANTLRDSLLNDGRHDKTGIASALDEDPTNGVTVYYGIHNMLSGHATTTATTQANSFALFPETGKTNHAYEKVMVEKKSVNKQDYLNAFKTMLAPWWLYFDVSRSDVVCIGPREVRILRTSVSKKE